MAGGGWRVHAAAESAKNKRCYSGSCDQGCSDHWSDLSSYVTSLSSADQKNRVDTLKSLAALLLCLARGDESVSQADGYAVSVPVGGDAVCVVDKDVVRLYKVLFLELGEMSRLLFTDSWFEHACVGEEVSHTEAYAQTLCCCIRIIPVVDMFNTSLGHSGSAAVNQMFQQLCSFFPTGSPKERRHVFLRSSLLEVFLDEILLHRNSSYIFLPEGEELVAQKNQAIVVDFECRAAAFAHMIHHQCLKGQLAVRFKDGDEQGLLQLSKLSLPAGVLLLDISTVNRFPSRLLTHIVSLVAGGLLPTGGRTLPDGLALGLASSVVETAMGLVSKHYSTWDFDSRASDDIGELLAALLRAISCAIVRTGRELWELKRRLDSPGAGIRRVVESVAAAISFNLPSMKFVQAIGCFDQKMVDALASENAGGVIGWTLVIFAHILFYESQRGLEEALAGEFLGVLDSLTGLLLLENDCRFDNSDFLLYGSWGSSTSGDLQCAGDDVNFYLQQVIKLLQRTVWDMCSRKKSTSNLLSFISKLTPRQRSRAEAVNFMTPDLTELEEAEHNKEATECAVRASTLKIAKRLKLKVHQIEPDSSCVTSLVCSPSKRRRKEQESSEPARVEPGENSYITEMLTRDKYEERFDDLSDFIVCKEGRSYSKFLNSRIKFRRRNHTRLIWKRREEKRSLLQALNQTS